MASAQFHTGRPVLANCGPRSGQGAPAGVTWRQISHGLQKLAENRRKVWQIHAALFYVLLKFIG
jgi:hypothetical protein